MGICWSFCCCRKNRDPETANKDGEPDPNPNPNPFPNLDGDSEQSTGVPHYLNDCDASFLHTHFSGNSWYSMVTTNLTSWMSQASGAIAAIWDNNAIELNEFPAEMDEDVLPDVEAISIDSRLRAFTFAELKAATFNFSPNMFLGKGGFGNVYKGWLKEKVPCQDSAPRKRGKKKVPSEITKKRAIAIKVLGSKSKQGYRQWRAEVSFLARTSHPNIIKLLGYCREEEQLLLVYEFMPKISLNIHLFGKRSCPTLPWNTRVKIMIGMAQGLCHLHMMEKPIIFRDFKSSNILLDESYTPKISDFGLAKWGPTDGSSCIRGHAVGTVGYAAPEYVATGDLFVKSDVYSLGVVLAETLTGLRAFDKNRKPNPNLVDYVKPRLSEKRRLKAIIDERLEGRYSLKEACIIGNIAAKCLNPVPNLRPSMKEVTEKLEKLDAQYKKKEVD